MDERITVRVPRRFFDDHQERGLILDACEVVTGKSNYVKATMTRRDVAALLDDARFYAENGVAEFGTYYMGLVRSAEATVRALAQVSA